MINGVEQGQTTSQSILGTDLNDPVVKTELAAEVLTGTAPIPNNDLTVALQIKVRELEMQNGGLRKENTNLKNRLDDLTTFTQSVMHDLRSPLTVIKGNSQLAVRTLLKDPANIPLAIQRLEQISKAVDVQVRNLDLNLTTRKFAEGELNMQRMNLTDFMLAAFEEIKTEVPPGISINNQITDEMTKIEADPAALIRVLANLVSNAVKFVPEDGRIDLRTQTEDKKAKIFVSDNGPGIEEDLHEKIFDPWYRIATGRTKNGLGLGLALCRKIMGKMGGTIKVHKSKPGEGTTMVVTLPAISTS